MQRHLRPMLEIGAATHEGARRDVNEDAFVATPLLALVADGMGGHDAGREASTIAAREIAASFESSPPRLAELDGLVERVHQLLVDVGRERDTVIGTTVVGAGVVDNGGEPTVVVFNVGDSRCYRLADDRFTQVTVDHSHVQELVTAGYLTDDEARVHPLRNVVTRALGTDGLNRPDVTVLPEGPCRLLLCSDGVSSELDDARLREVLEEEPRPEDAARRLVESVLAGPALDNATAVVVDLTFASATDAEPAAAVDGPITRPREAVRLARSERAVSESRSTIEHD